jgi:hypothetical protein
MAHRSPFTREDRFRLSYVGALYGSRNAAPVFAAAKQLIAREVLDPEILDIRVVGTASAIADGEALPLSFSGFVEHTDAVREMRSASALVFHQPPEQLGASGKIFEYLVSSRPILCVAHPDNVAYRLVQELAPASAPTSVIPRASKRRSSVSSRDGSAERSRFPTRCGAKLSGDSRGTKLAGDLAQLFRSVTAPVATA